MHHNMEEKRRYQAPTVMDRIKRVFCSHTRGSSYPFPSPSTQAKHSTDPLPPWSPASSTVTRSRDNLRDIRHSALVSDYVSPLASVPVSSPNPDPDPAPAATIINPSPTPERVTTPPPPPDFPLPIDELMLPERTVTLPLPTPTPTLVGSDTSMVTPDATPTLGGKAYTTLELFQLCTTMLRVELDRMANMRESLDRNAKAQDEIATLTKQVTHLRRTAAAKQADIQAMREKLRALESVTGKPSKQVVSKPKAHRYRRANVVSGWPSETLR